MHASQYDFLTAHTPDREIHDRVEISRNDMDRRFSCGVIDLKRLLTLNHKILPDKLNFYGFRVIINESFRSYLTNQTQITHAYPVSTKLISPWGVPQGSVLGPLLILL